MAFKDMYPYLPGHLVEFKDGGFAALQPEQNPPKTESVLIMGTSTDGPMYTPVAVDPATASMFGKVVDDTGIPNGASLLRGFEEVWQSGCRDVRLMRVSGHGASLKIEANPILYKDPTPYEQVFTTKGNNEVTFVLGHAPVAKIVEVKADADALLAAAYELNKASTATVQPDVPFGGEDDGIESIIYSNLLAAPVGANQEADFKINTIANVNADEDVKIRITLTDISKAADITLKYRDDAGVYQPMPFTNGVAIYGGTTGFVLDDESKEFSAKFSKGGLYEYKIALIKVSDSSVLAEITESVFVNATVTIKADVCKANSLITVKYAVDLVGDGNESDMVTYTENYTSKVDGTVIDWIAKGSDTVYDLTHVPMLETTRLLVKGTAIVANLFSVDLETKKLTVKAEARLEPGIDLVTLYTYELTSTVTPEITLETPWGGDVYNQTSAWVENVLNVAGQVVGKKLIIQMPVAKVGPSTKPLEYSSLKYPTFNSMVQAINVDLDTGNGIVKARTKTHFNNLLTKTMASMAKSYFEGGNSGIDISKQALFEAMGGKKDPVTGEYLTLGAYQLLENYKVDMIVPMDVFTDDELPNPENNFGYQLGMACAVISFRSRVVHGIIATNSPEDTSLLDIYNHANHLINDCPNNYFMKDTAGNVIYDDEGQLFDLGRYMSVLAGPDVTFKHQVLGRYNVNSAAIHAGMISATPVSSSPLGKKVPGIVGLRYTYGNQQLNALTAARFVTYGVEDNGRTVTVTDSMTAAQPGSDYANLVNWRSVKKCVDELRVACRPYIGEAPSVTNQNAMGTAIEKRFSALKPVPVGDGSVTDVKFEIIASNLDRVLGRSKVKLTVIPPGTLKQITTIVNVQPY